MGTANVLNTLASGRFEAKIQQFSRVSAPEYLHRRLC